MSERWLSRYSQRQLIRRRGAVEVYSAIELSTSERRLVLTGAADVLDAIAHAHSRIVGDGIAALDHRGADGGTEYVALISNAQFDLEHLVRYLSVEGRRFPHAEGMVIADRALVGLYSAHQTVNSNTNQPYALGSLCFANIVMGLDGTLEILGFGSNVLAESSPGTVVPSAGLTQAPEMLVGGTASPASDVCAFYGLWRALAGFADLPESLAAAITGRLDLRPELTALMVQLDRAAGHPNPHFRIPDISGLANVIARIRELHGHSPDADGFCLVMAEMGAAILGLMEDDEPTPNVARRNIRVSDQCKTVRMPDGKELDLSRRRAPRLLLARLLEQRDQHPGEALAWGALLEAGWPGERMHPESGRTRVHVAIYTLRKMGLADVVVRHDDGYLISPNVTAEMV